MLPGRSAVIGCQPAELLERCSVLRAVGPLLRRDDVFERGDTDGDAAEVDRTRPDEEILVAGSASIAGRNRREHVEIASVGPPRRDVHPSERGSVEVHRKRPGLFVGESLDAEVGTELTEGNAQPVEVLPRRLGKRVEVARRAGCTVELSTDSTDNQVLDTVAVEALGDGEPVDPMVHRQRTEAAPPWRSRSSSPRNASTFSLESSRTPSEVIDTSSEVAADRSRLISLISSREKRAGTAIRRLYGAV